MHTAPLQIVVEELTADAFTPFGEIIEASDAARHYPINAGSTERYHDLARIEPGVDGRAIVSIFRGQPRALPFTMHEMERHPLASQAFVPLSGRPWLAAVALPGEPPEADDIRVFRCRGDQGVNYAPGTWHHPLLALEAVSDFLVIDRAGPGDNCDVIQLARPAVIPA